MKTVLGLCVAMVVAAGCGPYETQQDATAESGDRVAATSLCATGAPVAELPGSIATPTAYFPDGTPTPGAVATRAPQTSPIDDSTPDGLASAVAGCRTPASTPTGEPTLPPPTPELAVTSTAVPASATAVPTETPAPPQPTGTSAVATASAVASRQVLYLSVGDGIQWGCCGALGSSSASLFRDHLASRWGREVIWQSPGSGYDTTDTFINGRDGQQSQLDATAELIDAYARNGIPLAMLTMSIGGNNLVDIGLNCPSPPCTDAFVTGLTHLREQLHVIYSRISAVKPANTPLLVLLYYDSNECTGPATSGAAVDVWNAVIAEVATQYGASLVDARSLFRGHCDWIDSNGLDANAAGHAAIAAEYARVYGALPPPYNMPP